jgi:hypothetical protein
LRFVWIEAATVETLAVWRDTVAKPMTLAEITKHPLWAKLNLAQQDFCARHLSGQSAVLSVKGAYPGIQDARVYAYRLLNHETIKRIHALFEGLSDVEILIADIRALVRKAKRKRPEAKADVLALSLIRVAEQLSEYNLAQKSTGSATN